MRKERKILRFVPQKLRKSLANGNPIHNKEDIEFVTEFPSFFGTPCTKTEFSNYNFLF